MFQGQGNAAGSGPQIHDPPQAEVAGFRELLFDMFHQFLGFGPWDQHVRVYPDSQVAEVGLSQYILDGFSRSHFQDYFLHVGDHGRLRNMKGIPESHVKGVSHMFHNQPDHSIRFIFSVYLPQFLQEVEPDLLKRGTILEHYSKIVIMDQR
jgi:hypothetical protein